MTSNVRKNLTIVNKIKHHLPMIAMATEQHVVGNIDLIAQ